MSWVQRQVAVKMGVVGKGEKSMDMGLRVHVTLNNRSRVFHSGAEGKPASFGPWRTLSTQIHRYPPISLEEPIHHLGPTQCWLPSRKNSKEGRLCYAPAKTPSAV